VADNGIPTDRYRRPGLIARTTASQAVRQAGTRAANVGRSDERAAVALERRQVEMAEQIVTVLGTMKGAAMKVGQVLSFLDIGLVPAEYRAEFQAKLSKLTDAAPTVSFDQMRKVLERDLAGRISEFFVEFDPEPIAAASIGQVYRAVLHDSRDVAVKVQYPGVATAVRADLKNLGLILRFVRLIAPEVDVADLAREIRERIEEELDYELEASNTRTVARRYRDHPFVFISDVVTALSREHVIVTEFVAGAAFDELCAEPQRERDRLGEIVFRFFFGSLYRHGTFSGDPHPGNLLRLKDGRVAFLDFGLVKAIDPSAVELEISLQRAVSRGDAAELYRLVAECGYLTKPERVDPADVMAYVSAWIWWCATRGPVHLTPSTASRVLLATADPRSPYLQTMRSGGFSAEHVIGLRMQLQTLALLGELGATADWQRIASEWMYDERPATALGRQDAKHFG
jgi:predicted unusual protein kinase regulating ubiquinone biosynthesis (AarF/ABC1/UbiB family)